MTVVDWQKLRVVLVSQAAYGSNTVEQIHFILGILKQKYASRTLAKINLTHLQFAVH